MKKEKVVLAYSGGLDTSIMIPWLKHNYNCDVVAMAADLGQGKELDGLEEKAKNTGASAVYIQDCREEFLSDYVFPTMKAGAIYEDAYLLGTSFARPLIAKHQVDIAHKENATMVAHGATGKGNDQVRFELAYMALDPSLKIIAPWKDPAWDMHSREACIEYAHAHNIPISQSKKRIYSEDANCWHISHEGGILEDIGEEAPEDVYTESNTLANAPDKPEYVTITFREGTPVAVDKEFLGACELLSRLNKRGATHAIGQVDMVENRLVGIKSRGVYETPGGTILYAAHKMLERVVLDRDTAHYKQSIARKYAELVYNGQWFSPLRSALDAFVTSTQQPVNGTVRLKLFKGHCIPAGVWSDDALYHKDLASFSDTQLYDQKDASGFIRLFGLPGKVAALTGRKLR